MTDRIAMVFQGVESKYDADAKLLNVKIIFKEAEEGGSSLDRRRGLEWDSTILSNSTYEGSNAFGAKKEISKLRALSYWIVLSDPFLVGAQKTMPSWMRERAGSTDEYFAEYSLSFSLPLEPQEAMAAKPKLSLLIFGHADLQRPMTEGIYYHDPKMDDPRDTIISYKNLVIEPEGAWLFDSASGRVYSQSKKQ